QEAQDNQLRDGVARPGLVGLGHSECGFLRTSESHDSNPPVTVIWSVLRAQWISKARATLDTTVTISAANPPKSHGEDIQRSTITPLVVSVGTMPATGL